MTTRHCGICGGRLELRHRGTDAPPDHAAFAPTCHTPGGHGDLFACDRCGTLQQPGLPQGAELLDLYRGMRDDDYLAEADGRRATARRLLDALERHAMPGRLLEIGCGHGLLLDEARKRGWEVSGLELAEASLAYARDELGLDVRAATLEELDPVREGGAQAIVLADVLEHLADPVDALRRCASLLADGGLLCVVTPDPSSVTARLAGRRWWALLPAHTFLVPRATLRSLLRAEGLDLREETGLRRTFTLGYWLAGLGERSAPVQRGLGALRRVGLARRPLTLSLGDERIVVARRGIAAPASAPYSTRMRAATRLVALFVVLCAAALVLSPGAQAGFYEVVACDPAVAGAAAPAWRAEASSGFPATVRCPHDPGDVGSGLFLATPSRASTFLEFGAFVFEAPSGTRLGSLSMDAAVARSESSSQWTAGVVAYDDNPLNPEQRPYGCTANQPCALPDGYRAVGPLDLGGLAGVRLTVACGAIDCPAQPGVARIAAARLRVTVLDDSNPALSVSGAGWTDQPRLRSAPIMVDASDNVGIRALALLVDGAEKARVGLDCQAAQRIPCPNAQDRTLSLQGSDVSDGPHTLTVRAFDAAQNTTDAQRTVTIVSPSGSRLTVGAAGRRGRAARSPLVSVRRSVLVRGRLARTDASALGGQEVGVSSTLLQSGARRRRIATVRTDGDGRFVFRVAPGPARLVRFEFAGNDVAQRSAAAISMRVPASTSIRVRPAVTRVGDRVRISGRLTLAGARVPRAGKLIVLQALERGRWRTFASTRARRSGTWSARYRFQRRAGRYRFRALVRRESGFPFFTGRSRAVRVTVSP